MKSKFLYQDVDVVSLADKGIVVRSFLKKGTPRYLFWSLPGSAPEQIWPKHLNACAGP